MIKKVTFPLVDKLVGHFSCEFRDYFKSFKIPVKKLQNELEMVRFPQQTAL